MKKIAALLLIAASAFASRDGFQLTRDKAIFTSPKFSSDGKKIVFSCNKEKAMHVWTMNTDGSHMSQVSNTSSDLSPSFSPKNDLIAFHGPGPVLMGHAFAIWLVPSSVGTPKRLIEGAAGEGQFPCWSADGNSVIWTHIRRLWIAGKDGSNPHALTKTPSRKFEFCGKTSPDGQWLAYLSDDGAPETSRKGAFELSVIRLNGLDQRKVGVGAARVVGWSKKSDAIYFQDGGEIFKVRLTGKSKPISIMKFRGANGMNVDMSPDHKWLVYDDTLDETKSTAQIYKVAVPVKVE